MKTIRYITILAWCLLSMLVGCASKVDPVPPKAIPAPRQSAAVSPLVDQAKADAAKGGEVSSRLEGKVESLQRTTGELRAGMSVATSEADRLRKQKAATEKELDGLWQLLNGTEARAAALFAEVETAKKIADEQKAHRVIAEKRLDELAKAAIARDTETAELRDQRDHLAGELDKAGKVHADMLARLSKAEQKAAVGSYLKGCIWFIGIVIVLVVAVRVMAFFKPL